MHSLTVNNIKGFSIDKVAKSIYVNLSYNKVARTDKKSTNMLVDYDKDNKIVGVELICLKSAEIKLAIQKGFNDFKRIIPEMPQQV